MNSSRNFADLVINNIKEEKMGVLLSSLIITARSALLLLPSIIIQLLIDKVLGKMELRILWKYCLGLCVIPVISACSIYIDKYFLKGLIRVANKSREELMKGLIYQEYQKQKEYNNSVNAFLVCDSVNDMASKLFDGTGNLIWCLFTVLSGIIFCLMQSLPLTIYLLIITLVEGKIVEQIGNKVGKINKEYLDVFTDKTVFFRESEAAIKEIKMQGCEERFIDQYNAILEREILWNRKEQKKDQLHKFVGELADALVYVGIYIGGAFFVLSGSCTIGNLVALGSLYDSIFMPVHMIGGMFLNMFSIENIVRKIDEIFYPYTISKKRVDEGVYSIGLQNVCYYYGDKVILQDANLIVKRNCLTFLFGESGSGKSTICDLLLGLIEPTKGQVIVNGKARRVEEFRKRIHYVSQKSMIINGTLRQNLLYGIDGGEIQDKKMIEVLHLAKLTSWFKTLPAGLDTVFENEGFTLSGGEKQRICLARALLGDPDILILDEALSAVDAENTSVILTQLKQLKKEMGILFITHNHNSYKVADVVFSLIEGKIRNIE